MKRLVALLLALAIPASGSSAECVQEKAIYADREGNYELRFTAADSEASSSTYRMVMTVAKSEMRLEGWVMESDPVNRPNGILFHDCPDGDTTGEELAKCTVWDGVIYAANSGRFDLLPRAGAPAASEVLLPGLPLRLVDSTAWGEGKATVVPWEAFSLKGCSS